MATVASLQRMTARTLSEIILAEASTAEPSYAIVDVRDDGNIILPPLPSKPHLQGPPTTRPQDPYKQKQTNTQKIT